MRSSSGKETNYSSGKFGTFEMTWLVLKKKARDRRGLRSREQVDGLPGGRGAWPAQPALRSGSLGDRCLSDMPGMLRLLKSVTFTQTEICLSVAFDPDITSVGSLSLSQKGASLWSGVLLYGFSLLLGTVAPYFSK